MSDSRNHFTRFALGNQDGDNGSSYVTRTDDTGIEVDTNDFRYRLTDTGQFYGDIFSFAVDDLNPCDIQTPRFGNDSYGIDNGYGGFPSLGLENARHGEFERTTRSSLPDLNLESYKSPFLTPPSSESANNYEFAGIRFDNYSTPNFGDHIVDSGKSPESSPSNPNYNTAFLTPPSSTSRQKTPNIGNENLTYNSPNSGSISFETRRRTGSSPPDIQYNSFLASLSSRPKANTTNSGNVASTSASPFPGALEYEERTGSSLPDLDQYNFFATPCPTPTMVPFPQHFIPEIIPFQFPNSYGNITTQPNISPPGRATVAPAAFRIESPNRPNQKQSIPRHRCPQTTCSLVFGRKSELERHFRTVHCGRFSYACNVNGCENNKGRGYSRVDKLREHLWRRHADLGFSRRSLNTDVNFV